jgi:acyl-CoA thioesterase-1
MIRMKNTPPSAAPAAVPIGATSASRHSGGRRAWLCCGAAALAVLAACGGGGTPGGAAPTAPAAPSAVPGTWVVMGSSTAAGVGASSGRGWAALLAERATPLQVTTVNLARAGALTPQALPAATPPAADRPAPDPAINIDRALGLQPRLLVLSFPSNDAVAGYPAAETAAHLARLRELAQARAAATVLLSTQPRDGLTPAQRATLDETDRLGAATFGGCFVDVRAALSGTDHSIAPAYAAGDGIHLNDAGHRLIADRLWAVLESGRCVRLQAP